MTRTTELFYQAITEPLLAQRIAGTVAVRMWAQSLDPHNPATWALAVRLVSRDGLQERGQLLPIRIGSAADNFGMNRERVVIKRIPLIPVDAQGGDRLVLEVGTCGPAKIELQ